jgi:hypothetical protein
MNPGTPPFVLYFPVTRIYLTPAQRSKNGFLELADNGMQKY